MQKFLDGTYNGNLYMVSFHGMMEHKQVMVQRLKYMQEKQYIKNADSVTEDYKKLADEAAVIRNLAIKYNISMKKELLEKISRLLEEMYITEKDVVMQLIELLDLEVLS